MNLEQLIAQFRLDAMDKAEPYLWEDPDVIQWLNEAQVEAVVRARLLLDDDTPAVTQLSVQAQKASYSLHAKLYEIVRIAFSGEGQRQQPLELVSREKLDRITPEWRSMDAGVPRWAIQDDTRIRLVPMPARAGTLLLEGYRLPLKAMVNDTDKPEIHEAHHPYLVHWALHRAFSMPDSDGFDPQRAITAEAAFTGYFGMRPDADLRRTTRHDEPNAIVNYLM